MSASVPVRRPTLHKARENPSIIFQADIPSSDFNHHQDFEKTHNSFKRKYAFFQSGEIFFYLTNQLVVATTQRISSHYSAFKGYLAQLVHEWIGSRGLIGF